MARILVLGSGFAGLEAVERLSVICDVHECILVTERARLTFTPLLPKAAAGGYPLEKLAWSVHGYARSRGFSVVEGRVVGVKRGSVLLEDGESISYDYAVLCLGGKPCFYGVPGAREYGLTLCSLEDAARIRSLLGKAEGFIVVGAGPVGVELAGELAARGENVHLVEMLDKPLAMLGNARASRLVENVLKGLGVRLVLGRRVVEVSEGYVRLEDGLRLGCSGCVVVWAAGLEGPGVRVEGGAVDKRGFILVDPWLRVEGYSSLYAAGDATVHRVECQPLKVAREALRMARVAAVNVAESLGRGRPAKRYKPLITTCRPLLAVCMAGRCIVVAGKRLAFTSRLAEWYHEKLRSNYEKMLGGR